MSNEDDLITKGLSLVIEGVKLGNTDKVIEGITIFYGDVLTWGQDKPKSRLQEIKDKLKKEPPEEESGGAKVRKPRKPQNPSGKIEIFQPEEVEKQTLKILENEELPDDFAIKASTIKGGERFGNGKGNDWRGSKAFKEGKIEILSSPVDQEELKKNQDLAKKATKMRRPPQKSILENPPKGLYLGNIPPRGERDNLSENDNGE